jgi:hypothetical protein
MSIIRQKIISMTRKVKCKTYIRKEAMPFINNHYGFEGKGCGLCQTKVPCESKIPVRQETK